MRSLMLGGLDDIPLSLELFSTHIPGCTVLGERTSEENGSESEPNDDENPFWFQNGEFEADCALFDTFNANSAPSFFWRTLYTVPDEPSPSVSRTSNIENDIVFVRGCVSVAAAK